MCAYLCCFFTQPEVDVPLIGSGVPLGLQEGASRNTRRNIRNRKISLHSGASCIRCSHSDVRHAQSFLRSVAYCVATTLCMQKVRRKNYTGYLQTIPATRCMSLPCGISRSWPWATALPSFSGGGTTAQQLTHTIGKNTSAAVYAAS